jgi:hypothetical protein
MSKRKTMIVYLLPLTGLVALAIAGAKFSTPYSLESITIDSIVERLAPVVMIALFVERAQEVFISAWRDIEKWNLERTVAKAKAKAAPVAEEIEAAEQQLDKHQCETRRIAFAAGVIMGTVISALGVRVVQPLIQLPSNGQQLVLFNLVDVLLTAGLIGGGSDGIHKVVSVFTDFLDVTRQKINASTP